MAEHQLSYSEEEFVEAERQLAEAERQLALSAQLQDAEQKLAWLTHTAKVNNRANELMTKITAAIERMKLQLEETIAALVVKDRIPATSDTDLFELQLLKEAHGWKGKAVLPNDAMKVEAFRLGVPYEDED